MTALDSMILGLVQGLTEFIPVSSSGHLIIVREWLGLSADGGLAFDAVLQLATIFAVLVYFWKDLWGLFVAFLRWAGRKGIETEKKTMILAIALGTVPGVAVGIFLEEYMETAFRSAALVAATLIAGAIVFFLAEYAAKRYSSILQKTEIEKGRENAVTIKKGFWIGCFQALALIPGMSRSGMTISGGLFLGLSREIAARFSFLLAFPIIAGAGFKKFLDIAGTGELQAIGGDLLLGSIVAFVSGLAAIHFLITFLKKHTLIPFAIYRVALALGLLLAL